MFDKDSTGNTRFNPKPARWLDEKLGFKESQDKALLASKAARDEAIASGKFPAGLAKVERVFGEFSEGVRSKVASQPIATAAQFAAGYGVGALAAKGSAFALNAAPKLATSSFVKGSLIGLQGTAAVVYGSQAAVKVTQDVAAGSSVAGAIGGAVVPVVAFALGVGAVPSAKINVDSYRVNTRTSVTNADKSVTIFERGVVSTDGGAVRSVSTRVVVPKSGDARFFSTLRNSKGKVVFKDTGVYSNTENLQYLIKPSQAVNYETTTALSSSRTGKSATSVTEGVYDLYPNTGSNLFKYNTNIGNKDISVEGISKVTSRGRVVTETFTVDPIVKSSTSGINPLARGAYNYVNKKYPFLSSGAAGRDSSSFFPSTTNVVRPASPSYPSAPSVNTVGFDVVSLTPSALRAGVLLPSGVKGSSQITSSVSSPSSPSDGVSSREGSDFVNKIELTAKTQPVAESTTEPVGSSGSRGGSSTQPTVEVVVESKPTVEPVIEPVPSVNTVGLFVPAVVPVVPIIPLLGLSVDKKRVGKSSGFDVFVRKEGKFVKASPFAFSKRDALDLGAFTVSNSPRATFVVRPSSSSSSGRPLGVGVSGSFGRYRGNFYKKGDSFIEKRGKRIKSSGEKAGITMLGIAAIKSGKTKKKGKKKKNDLFDSLRVF